MDIVLAILFAIAASAITLIMCVYWNNKKRLNEQIKVFYDLAAHAGVSKEDADLEEFELIIRNHRLSGCISCIKLGPKYMLSDKERIALALLNKMKYDGNSVDKALRLASDVFYHNYDGVLDNLHEQIRNKAKQ